MPDVKGLTIAMRRIWKIVGLSLVLAVAMCNAPVAFGPSLPAVAAPAPTDPGWPRQFKSGVYTFSIYQPQLDNWDYGSHLSAHAAVAVRTGGAAQPTFGVIWVMARTLVDKESRLVALDEMKIAKVSFPTAPDKAAVYQKALQAAAPTEAKYISLDRLEALMQTVQSQQKAEALPLNTTPPNIIVSYGPAILVLIDGVPVLRPVEGTSLQRVLNTSPLLLQDLNNGNYYIHVYDGWMQSTSLTGSYGIVYGPPAALNTALQKVVATHQVDLLTGGEAKPVLVQARAPAIYVSTSPAALIVIGGVPNFLPILGTQLLYVQNTSGRIFKDLQDHKIYVLLGGRWFRAANFSGPWTYVPGKELPPDFAKIPDDSLMENVKADVPGTPQAQEAVIANSVAQTAAVDRSGTQMSPPPTFDGAPQPKPIDGTPLQYIANASTPIIVTGDQGYYAVQNGIWFTAASVNGPWGVATSVPAEIYSIPPRSPLYSETFVRIYNSTPTTVYEGYTPGYLGAFVSDGVPVYGTGYTYLPWIGSTWYGSPVTYGFGANIAWTPWMGWGFSYGFGPTWGDRATLGFGWGGWGWGTAYGGWPVYARTGGVAWGPGGWAGTSGNVYHQWGDTSAVSRTSSGYNAWTGNSWQNTRGVSYNSRTGTLSAGAYGTVTNVRTGQTYSGGTVRTYNPATGQLNTTTYNAKTGSVERSTYNTDVWRNTNNVYADKDGQIYRQDPATGWQHYDSGGNWSKAGDSATPHLDQESYARQLGDDRTSFSTGPRIPEIH